MPRNVIIKRQLIKEKIIITAIIIKKDGQTTVYRRRKKGAYVFMGKETNIPEIVAKTLNDNPPLFAKSYLPVACPQNLVFAGAKLATDKEKIRFKALQDAGILYLTEGWLWIKSWQKRKGRLKQAPKRTGEINKAIRMMEYILSHYKLDEKQPAEINQIRRTEDLLQAINTMLANWQIKGKKNRAKINRALALLILELQNCYNEYKVAVREQLQATLGLRDSLNRPNPGAAAARVFAAIGNIQKRIDEFRFILPKIALRHELLCFERECFETERKLAINRTINLLNKDDDFFQNQQQRKYVHTAINKIMFNVYRFWVNPYYQAHTVIIPILEAAKESFDRGLIRPAKNDLDKALYILENEI